MASESEHSPPLQPPPPPPTTSPNVHFPQSILEKLAVKDYLFRCAQVEPVIRSFKLHWFSVNSQIPTKHFSVIDRDTNRVTDEYVDWEARDQLLSWLQSMISKFFLKSSLASPRGSYGTESTTTFSASWPQRCVNSNLSCAMRLWKIATSLNFSFTFKP